MTNSGVSTRLPPGDALWLYLEKPEMPLHIGSVFIFDGPISWEDLAAYIEAKLPLIPRYRQRVVFPPLLAGHPTWEFDPEFDLRNHVLQAHLERGTLEALETKAGQIYSQIMRRDRPLWDLTVVDGLEGGRSALIARVHHCMVDGVAGVALLSVLLDSSAAQAQPSPPKEPFHPPPLPAAPQSLLEAVVGSYAEMLNRILSVEKAALNLAEGFVSDFSSGAVSQLTQLVPELFTPVQPLPFNVKCLGPRKVAWAEFSLDDFNAVRQPSGAKVNDVAMLVLAGAIRRYAQLHGLPANGRLLRLMTPVNLRRDTHSPGLGNMISMMPVNIPLDTHDPVTLLKTIHEKTGALKQAHLAELIVAITTWLGIAPASFHALAWGLLGNQLPMPLFNMVCTNVAGPPVPLYALGRKMLTYYPYVPVGNYMGVCCAITSYNGTLYFGLTGDSASAPDLSRIRDFLYEAFAELQAAVGLAPPKRLTKPMRPGRKQRAVAGS